MARASGAKQARLRKPQAQQFPSELQERLMRTLKAADKPLMASDIACRLGMFANEPRGYCDWLTSNNYIKRTVKKVPRIVSGHGCLKPVAFWNLSEKGIEYLDVLDAKHAAVPDIATK
jgi:hypothetical protein